MSTCSDRFEYVEKYYNLLTFVEYLSREGVITSGEQTQIQVAESTLRVSCLREIITKKGKDKAFCDCVKKYPADSFIASWKVQDVEVDMEEMDDREVRPHVQPAQLAFDLSQAFQHGEASQNSDISVEEVGIRLEDSLHMPADSDYYTEDKSYGQQQQQQQQPPPPHAAACRVPASTSGGPLQLVSPATEIGSRRQKQNSSHSKRAANREQKADAKRIINRSMRKKAPAEHQREFSASLNHHHLNEQNATTDENDLLKDNYVLLVNHINLSELIPHLMEHRVITDAECESLGNREELEKSKIIKLLNFISRKGSKSIKEFILCIQNEKNHTGHEHIISTMQSHRNT